MKTIKKELVIEKLTINEVNTRQNEDLYLYGRYFFPQYLCETTKYGCTGFNYLSNEDLIKEWLIAFDEQIKIK
jgi:hypothetical protein